MEIVLPTSRQGLSNLYKGIKTKVLADGPTGECAGFIIAQSIDVTFDYGKTLDSLVHEEGHGVKFRLGEKNNAQADAVFNLIETVCRGIGKELTSLYAPDRTHKIDYGFDISPTGASTFPTTQDDWKTLFTSINTQYLTFPVGTADIEPLLIKKGWVMATLVTNLAAAVTQKLTAAQNHRDAKTETQSANADMATADINIHKFANFLHGRHDTDARALGDYSFDTSDAPQLEKDQISTAPIGSQRQIQHIIFGSIMTNMTADPLIVFKGNTMTGAGITIPGFGELAMTKGYNRAIIKGTNPLKDGIAKVRVGR